MKKELKEFNKNIQLLIKSMDKLSKSIGKQNILNEKQQKIKIKEINEGKK